MCIDYNILVKLTDFIILKNCRLWSYIDWCSWKHSHLSHRTKMGVPCKGESHPLHIKDPITFYHKEWGANWCCGTHALTPSTGPLGRAVCIYILKGLSCIKKIETNKQTLVRFSLIISMYLSCHWCRCYSTQRVSMGDGISTTSELCSPGDTCCRTLPSRSSWQTEVSTFLFLFKFCSKCCFVCNYCFFCNTLVTFLCISHYFHIHIFLYPKSIFDKWKGHSLEVHCTNIQWKIFTK